MGCSRLKAQGPWGAEDGAERFRGFLGLACAAGGQGGERGGERFRDGGIGRIERGGRPWANWVVVEGTDGDGRQAVFIGARELARHGKSQVKARYVLPRQGRGVAYR